MTHVSPSSKRKDDWMNNKWRPMMGWTYMGTCIFDFIVAPILWSIIQIVGAGKVEMQWQPLTLQGAGLYHIAMGAVLGITAWSRGQEKITGVASGFTSVQQSPYTQQSYPSYPQQPSWQQNAYPSSRTPGTRPNTSSAIVPQSEQPPIL